jgi:CheY-like chemotaxis protein
MNAALRVLIVDDLPDMAESLAMLVRVWGHNPAVAYNGRQALRMAQATRPDAVLLDLSIPAPDGYEVARRLRAEPGLAGLLLVAVTGYSDDHFRRLAREAGFDFFLLKPVEPELLEWLLEARTRQPR